MKQFMSWCLAALLFAATAVVSPAQDVDSVAPVTEASEQLALAACGPRIRKPWELLLPQEKELYLRAIAMSMDDGYYIKFVEIHTEQMTTVEAHNTCMFIYWHRLLLLGFENMLRSYGGEFSCITVPYWNYVDDNQRYMAGGCRSMEECSLLLREFGGSLNGYGRSVNINGSPIGGTCVVTPPLDHFCEASHLHGGGCARCVPRGNWLSSPFPPTTTVSSLARQLFATPTIAGVVANLELGIHDTVHSALSGAMGFLEAPADPIFFSHHATIDLLHSIYYKCVVGNTVPIPLEQKLGDPRVYTECPRREPLPVNVLDRNVLLPQSNILLRTGEEGINPTSVFSQFNMLDPFFSVLPSEYLSLSDIRDIGVFSYNYEMTGLLAEMFMTCPGAGFGLGMAGAETPFRHLESSANTTEEKSKFVEAVIVPSNQTVATWYKEALAAASNSSSVESAMADASQDALTAIEDVEKMTCVFYDECRGGVHDFSDDFRQSFHANGSSPCSAILTNIKSGRDHIQTPNWRSIFLRHMKCDDA
ncbi:Tyrosinase ustQ [Phytophthora ramorum]|uniref:Tyrosinase copper-binding domain-containing protein n=1 Tax=Phytophthora ramorum TaxID=164328 RepID=H3GCI8_PHYRM|nr:Tyrosinase ustQ [Phytophthora ramorum]